MRQRFAVSALCRWPEDGGRCASVEVDGMALEDLGGLLLTPQAENPCRKIVASSETWMRRWTWEMESSHLPAALHLIR